RATRGDQLGGLPDRGSGIVHAHLPRGRLLRLSRIEVHPAFLPGQAERAFRYNRQQNLACWAALLARRPGAPPKIRTRYTHHRLAPPRLRRPAHGRLRPPRLPPAATPPGGARLIVWP